MVPVANADVNTQETGPGWTKHLARYSADSPQLEGTVANQLLTLPVARMQLLDPLLRLDAQPLDWMAPNGIWINHVDAMLPTLAT